MGLHIEMARQDAPRDDSLTTEPALGTARIPITLPPLSPAAGALLATVTAILAAVGFFLGRGVPEPGFAGAIRTFPDLFLSLGTGWLAFSGLVLVEGALAADSVQGTGALVRMHRGLPCVEPVCWRLGVPASEALLALVLPLSALAATLGWHRVWPAGAAGAGMGAILYLIQAAYPLKPGPGARILERLTHLDDLPTRLQWSLVERFLPWPTDVEVGGGRAMVVAGLALAAWAGGSAQALHGLSASSPSGLTLPGSIWRGAAVLGLVVWAVWLVARVGGLFRSAARIRGDAHLEPLEPSGELLRAWAEENPLNRHLPELRRADWHWGLVRRGAFLIREGARDRDFFWLARGRMHVMGRSDEGDPVHITTVGGGVGLGEIGLLDGRDRTADVMAAEDSVVAVLSRDELREVAGQETVDRFREVVQASQSLARSPVLWGLSPDSRSHWLGHGRPSRYGEGEVLVEQGEERRWIGLVVNGRLAVERDGRKVGTVKPDGVFGEIAYLTGRPRSATLRAEEPVLVWRWEPEWLDREIVESGLARGLRELAEERAHVSR